MGLREEGVVIQSLEKLPAGKEGIYDVYGEKVQPGRTRLSHYKAAFNSQSDIFYHLRGQAPQERKHGSFQRPGGGWQGPGESQGCGCQAGRAFVQLHVLLLGQEGDTAERRCHLVSLEPATTGPPCIGLPLCFFLAFSTRTVCLHTSLFLCALLSLALCFSSESSSSHPLCSLGLSETPFHNA